MKTSEEFRAHKLQMLPLIVRRPAMYGGQADGVDVLMRELHWDLSYIDEREGVLETERQRAENRYGTGSAGPLRTLQWIIGDEGCDCLHEAASIYAEMASRLGYLELDRRLSGPEWRSLRKGLRAGIQGADWSVQQVTDRFGEPSIRVGSTLAYAPEDAGLDWAHFDFCYGPEPDAHLRPEKLRDVRLPGCTGVRQFVFTPFGRKFRRKQR